MFEVEILKNELESNRLRYEQFCRELKKQIESLLNESDIKLATPIEWRVKEWGSFYDKCISNNKQPISIFDMNDIAGLRIICLLADDVKKAENILVNNFNIRKHENTHERLLENQFGYGSIHFEITLKADWIKVPTFKNYKNIIAEIQLRTISQHIWASVSHLLQYKKEQDVPPQLKRSINRTAALLEIIDNEFERLFIERKKLVQKNIIHEETILNIESLKTILNESLPILNKRVDEPYSILLDELFRFNINTIEKLRELISKHLLKMIEADKRKANEVINHSKFNWLPEETKLKVQQGVWYSQIGFMRGIMTKEFGKRFEKYQELKFSKNFHTS